MRMSGRVSALWALTGWIALSSTATIAVTSAERFAELEGAFEAAVERFMEAYAAAGETEREALLADPEREPRQLFTPLFLEAARSFRGQDAALTGWTWLAEHGTIADRESGEEAIARILGDHLASPELSPAAKAIRRCAGIRGRERTLADLDAIVAGSPHRPVQAEALLQRGLLLRRSDDASDLEAAREALERAARMSPDPDTLKDVSEALAELGFLAVGTAAPALAGTTLDGLPLDLRDLRGRVILVEFWGMWCGPCVAKLPELNRLHSRYRDRAFTLLGVNSDPDPERVRAFLAREAVGWPSLADGSTDGPLATAWRVGAWPAGYVIDREGVIRGRDLSGDELYGLVENLLDGPD